MVESKEDDAANLRTDVRSSQYKHDLLPPYHGRTTNMQTLWCMVSSHVAPGMGASRNAATTAASWGDE